MEFVLNDRSIGGEAKTGHSLPRQEIYFSLSRTLVLYIYDVIFLENIFRARRIIHGSNLLYCIVIGKILIVATLFVRRIFVSEDRIEIRVYRGSTTNFIYSCLIFHAIDPFRRLIINGHSIYNLDLRSDYDRKGEKNHRKKIYIRVFL